MSVRMVIGDWGLGFEMGVFVGVLGVLVKVCVGLEGLLFGWVFILYKFVKLNIFLAWFFVFEFYF